MIEKPKKPSERERLRNYIASQLEAKLEPSQKDLLKRNADGLRKVVLGLITQALIDLSSEQDPKEREMIWTYQNALKVLEIQLSYYK